MLPGVPGKVTVDVSQDLHEVRVDGGEADTGSFSHVDGALLCQIHVVEVDELKLGLLLWPEQTKHSNKRNIIHDYFYFKVLGKPFDLFARCLSIELKGMD